MRSMEAGPNERREGDRKRASSSRIGTNWIQREGVVDSPGTLTTPPNCPFLTLAERRGPAALDADPARRR